LSFLKRLKRGSGAAEETHAHLKYAAMTGTATLVTLRQHDYRVSNTPQDSQANKRLLRYITVAFFGNV
jgi:hypothetical protein